MVTVQITRRGDRLAAWVAWLVTASAAVAVSVALALHPSADLAWDAVIIPLQFCIPGALIAGHLPRHPVGWLMLFVGACFAGNAVALQWLASDRQAGAAWMAWWAERGSAVLVPATLLVLLLIPDGHLPSPAWRPVVRLVVGVQLAMVALAWLTAGPFEIASGADGLSNPLGVLPNGWRPFIAGAIDLVFILPFLLGIAAVVQRIRRPNDDERPRAVSVLTGVVAFVLLVTVPDLAWPEAAVWFHIAGGTVLSGVILAAVLRGRFDRVQVVVSYALVYSALTVTLVVAYVALLALSTRIAAPPAVAGLLTAGVALALLPARRTLQAALRRAMYGDRGEPHRALRRLSSSVGESDDLVGVLAGLARSVRASLRARWVEAEFRGFTAVSGEAIAGGSVVKQALRGEDGPSGTLRVGLAPGRSLRDDELDLLTDLAEHGARAARIVCLADDLSAARHQLVEGREAERSRLRRELHDNLGPVLAGLAMQLGSMPDLVREDSALAGQRLARLEAEAREALGRMRQLSQDLRPPALDELGLAGAVVEVGRALGMRVDVNGTPDVRLSPAVEVAAYRIAVEAVLNAHRHAGVEDVQVAMRISGGALELEVTDHGSGMHDAPAGVGVLSMRERAVELGGSVVVVESPGGGTTVQAVLPAAAEEAGTR